MEFWNMAAQVFLWNGECIVMVISNVVPNKLTGLEYPKQTMDVLVKTYQKLNIAARYPERHLMNMTFGSDTGREVPCPAYFEPREV